MARPRRSPALLVVALVAACAVRGGAHPPPPPPPPAEPHLFRANDSLLGTRVRCSEDERECLRYNRLLDAASGKCFRVGSRGPCAQADAPAPAVFLLDKAEFEARGRLVGVCADPGRCPDRRFRMAWDGRCYSGKQVFGEFCDVRAGASAWPYFFGGYECVCDGARCPAASYVQQPPRRGECRFPNFRKDLSSGFLPRLPGDDLRCSAAQSWCFSNGQVAFGEDGKCYELLARGPCSPRQHLVLDKQQAFLNRKIATLCVPVERCPAGFRFMTQRQKCVNETKIKNVMCPELKFFTDVFGDTVCRFEEEFYKVELTSPQEGLCKLRYNVQLRDLQEETKSDCTDPLECLPLEEIPPDVLDEKLRA